MTGVVFMIYMHHSRLLGVTFLRFYMLFNASFSILRSDCAGIITVCIVSTSTKRKEPKMG